MMRHAWILSIVSGFLMASGCGGSEDDGGTEDGGTDADVDGDSDMDADTDADGDTDTDTGIDAGECNGMIGEEVPNEGAGHCGEETPCDGLTWENNPPASGMHCPSWEQTEGEHTDPVPRCNYVHNLEHSWIVLLYNCETPCDADLEIMREAMANAPDGAQILLTPDPDLDSKFAAVAWDWVWEGETVDLETLTCFIEWHWGCGTEFESKDCRIP